MVSEPFSISGAGSSGHREESNPYIQSYQLVGNPQPCGPFSADQSSGSGSGSSNNTTTDSGNGEDAATGNESNYDETVVTEC
jgi:hypothetical protein